jgi:hypothetical protein
MLFNDVNDSNHLNNIIQTLSEQVDYTNMTTSELYDNFRPPKTLAYDQMINIEF